MTDRREEQIKAMRMSAFDSAKCLDALLAHFRNTPGEEWIADAIERGGEQHSHVWRYANPKRDDVQYLLPFKPHDIDDDGGRFVKVPLYRINEADA